LPGCWYINAFVNYVILSDWTRELIYGQVEQSAILSDLKMYIQALVLQMAKDSMTLDSVTMHYFLAYVDRCKTWKQSAAN
jgi:hypothetical protein